MKATCGVNRGTLFVFFTILAMGLAAACIEVVKPTSQPTPGAGLSQDAPSPDSAIVNQPQNDLEPTPENSCSIACLAAVAVGWGAAALAG